MGTFMGHVVPGVFFALFGIWHVTQISYRYFRNGKKSFVSNTYFDSVTCFKNRLPVESVIKIVGATVHITLEITTGYDSTGRFVYFGNTQHMAMLALFALLGIIEIIEHNRINLPNKTRYMAITAAFLYEAFAFSTHLHGRNMVDTTMHIAVVLMSMLIALLVAIEMRYQRSAQLALASRCLIVLQGAWFMQIGFVLYPPFEAFKPGRILEEHEASTFMIATLGFQAVFIVILVLGIWSCFAAKYGQLVLHDKQFDSSQYQLIGNGGDHQCIGDDDPLHSDFA